MNNNVYPSKLTGGDLRSLRCKLLKFLPESHVVVEALFPELTQDRYHIDWQIQQVLEKLIQEKYFRRALRADYANHLRRTPTPFAIRLSKPAPTRRKRK